MWFSMLSQSLRPLIRHFPSSVQPFSHIIHSASISSLSHTLPGSSLHACSVLSASSLHASTFGCSPPLAIHSRTMSSSVDNVEDTRQAWDGSSSRSLLSQVLESSASMSSGAPPASASDSNAPPVSESATVLNDVEALLLHMGITPGRGCVVGEGLAEVELGVFVNGVQIALELGEQTDGAGTGSKRPDPRTYAAQRTRDALLKAHGWIVVELPTGQWLSAKDNHARQHLLLEVLKAVMEDKKQKETEGHVHSGGCCGGGH